MKIGMIYNQPQFKEKIRDAVHHETDHDIIWVTSFGRHAIQQSETHPPDLILLDVQILAYEGIQLVFDLKSHVKCPIILLTHNLKKYSSLVFEAMAHGALDCAEIFGDDYRGLIEKIQQMALIVHDESLPRVPKREVETPKLTLTTVPLIVIGASTGGPLALASILSSFPQNLEASVVIVQHVDEKFSSGLANWLEQRTRLPIELVAGETVIESGKVYLSDSQWYLKMSRDKKLGYTSEMQANVYKPSIDVFFESVAKNWPNPSIAILLTGMGSDGALGMKKLRDKGWITIAEDESSCVVYGMPKAAVEAGAACEVLNLQNIPLSVLTHLKKRKFEVK